MPEKALRRPAGIRLQGFGMIARLYLVGVCKTRTRKAIHLAFASVTLYSRRILPFALEVLPGVFVKMQDL